MGWTVWLRLIHATIRPIAQMYPILFGLSLKNAFFRSVRVRTILEGPRDGARDWLR